MEGLLTNLEGFWLEAVVLPVLNLEGFGMPAEVVGANLEVGFEKRGVKLNMQNIQRYI